MKKLPLLEYKSNIWYFTIIVEIAVTVVDVVTVATVATVVAVVTVVTVCDTIILETKIIMAKKNVTKKMYD